MNPAKIQDQDRFSLPIEEFEQRLLVDNSVINQIHREFVDQVNRLAQADDKDLPALFEGLIQHTRVHFDTEQQLMEASRFPGIGKHWSEHQRVLTEMVEYGQRIAAGSLGPVRAYLRQGLPDWFEEHVFNMDRILAIHLRHTENRD